MNKHFITIILLLLCLLVSRPVEARLTLGVVTGPDEAAGEIASTQAHSLASLLTEKLQEEVVVKELTDSATLMNWLDRFAMLDLALLSAKEVKDNPGRFLQIGPFDGQGRLSLVARQGVAGDLPQRVGTIVRESGFATGRAVEAITPSAKQSLKESPLLAEPEPASIDDVIASQTELQHVPPLSPGKAWSPQEENTYRDILPADDALKKNLVLGVFPEPGGLVRTSQQAEQLAVYLEQVLPVSVKVREFTRVEAFAEWFMRYRMVDLAVLSPAAAQANLGRDYLPVATLLRSDKPGLESAELVVMRRGQNEEMQAPLRRALLDMLQTENGQSLMAAFKISEVLTPEGVSSPRALVDQKPEPTIEAAKPLLELAEEPVDELLPSSVEYADPVVPVPPAEVSVALPELTEVAEPVAVLPLPQMPDTVPTLPEAAEMPAEPIPPAIAQVIKVPDLPVRQSEPLQPEVPSVLTVEDPIVLPEHAEPIEPVAPLVVVDKMLPQLPDAVKPAGTLSLPLIPDAASALFEPVAMPAEPVAPAMIEAIKVPDVASRQLEPLQPEVPPVPVINIPNPPAELIDIAEPDLLVPAIEPVEVALKPVPEAPTIVVVTPMKQQEVVPAPNEALDVTEPSVAPAFQPADSAQGQDFEETITEVALPVMTEVTLPNLAEPLDADQIGVAVDVVERVPDELEAPAVMPTESAVESELVVSEEPDKVEQQEMVKEILNFADPVPAHMFTEVEPSIADETTDTWSEEDFAAVLNEDLVATAVAQPDLPQELRPSGVPVVRPGRIAQRTTAAEDQLLLASIPEPRKNIVPPRPPNLLPEPEPEPGVIYVVPFVSVMVPPEVNARVFDQFVDTLNREGEALGLQFVILKEGLQRVSPEWLSIRKYVTGEIYAYVEESGCCSTDLRSKARLTYRRPNQQAPSFGFEYPVKNFFDHDRSSLEVERAKLADDIAAALSGELLKALQN